MGNLVYKTHTITELSKSISPHPNEKFKSLSMREAINPPKREKTTAMIRDLPIILRLNRKSINPEMTGTNAAMIAVVTAPASPTPIIRRRHAKPYLKKPSRL